MSTPSTVFTQVVSTTFRNHPGKITDNVSAHNALLAYLKQRGHIETYSGGYEIARSIDYSENVTYQRYSGYDELNVASSDVITAVTYPHRQAAVHVSASGEELRINSGTEKMTSLIKAKIKNAERTAANNMSVDLYSDGSLAKQIGGLAHIISNDGNGTVGGINAASWTFWKNQFVEASSNPDKSNIRGFMNSLYLKLVRGTDKPNLIVMTHDLYSIYEASLQELQRYTDEKSAGAGFPTLKYKGVPVVFDSNTNFGTTAEIAYFLNLDYLMLLSHEAANWTQLDDKVPTRQDAVVIPIIWMGNLVCTNRALQGKLIDAA
jgi:hypothetical protein